MNLCVIGTGYVGLVAGACFAEIGNVVTCVDSDATKVAALQHGQISIYEPGLEAIVKRNIAEGRLTFTQHLAPAARRANVCLIAVGTPVGEGGAADLTHVLNVARGLGQCVTGSATVVVKSTVPVGTTDQVEAIMTAELQRRGVAGRPAMAFNPEFLREGNAVNDFLHPDRVILGSRDERAIATLRQLYSPLIRSHERLLIMDVRDAEITKYAANAMLATRISLMNEIASLCEKLGADIERVRVGVGSDSRIGYDFIQPGCGYGGSCFPKDVRALIGMADANGLDAAILRAVAHRNKLQTELLPGKIKARFGANLSGLHFGLWGLAFKPGTDDMREAPARALLEAVIGAGATVCAHDPAAMDTARQILPADWFNNDQLRLARHQYDAVRDADALLLVTEWEPYHEPDLAFLRKSMRQRVIFDGRNVYEPRLLRESGFEYHCIGRAAADAVGLTPQLAAAPR